MRYENCGMGSVECEFRFWAISGPWRSYLKMGLKIDFFF
jgi:hypothetical protein